MAEELIPLSAYVHLPWCVRKCPYCDFNSHENKELFNERDYIDCLLEDFKRDLHLSQERPLESIFIGGGTPSLIQVEEIDRLLEGIKKQISFDSNIEITIEANPASSQDDYFQALCQTAVNRVSIGIQSFEQKHLSYLGDAYGKSTIVEGLPLKFTS